MASIMFTNKKPIPPGGSWIISEEDLIASKKTLKETMKLRGAIIAGAIEIEDEIERLIQKFFFKDDLKLGKPFSEKVIQNENITLRTKYQILKELIKDLLSKSELKEYNKQVLEMIERRNKYAHGKILFKDTEPYLISHGGKKELKLDKKVLEEAILNLVACVKIFKIIEERIGKKSD